jgi:hypothetical protein
VAHSKRNGRRTWRHKTQRHDPSNACGSHLHIFHGMLVHIDCFLNRGFYFWRWGRWRCGQRGRWPLQLAIMQDCGLPDSIVLIIDEEVPLVPCRRSQSSHAFRRHPDTTIYTEVALNSCWHRSSKQRDIFRFKASQVRLEDGQGVLATNLPNI